MNEAERSLRTSRHPAASITAPVAPAVPPAASSRTAPLRRGWAARCFGYDIFLSFALGPPPRGVQAYASDLARQLRERDGTVFFSDEEMPPGQALSPALEKALARSNALVVIANREMLREPRWVRLEVERFRHLHPSRPVIPVNVDGALQDAELAEPVGGSSPIAWLGHAGRVWVDESAAALNNASASAAVVERIGLVPGRMRSNVWWRVVVTATLAMLVALAIALAFAAQRAAESAEQARAEARHAVALRLAAEAAAMFSRAKLGGEERALQQLLAARALAPATTEIDDVVLMALTAKPGLEKVLDLGVRPSAMALSPDRRHLAIGDHRGHVQLRELPSGRLLSPAQRGHGEAVWSLAFSADGKRLASAGGDGSVTLWHGAESARIATLKASEGAVWTLALNRDGTRLVTGASDGEVKLWDLGPTNATVQSLGRHGGAVRAVAWAGSDTRIVSGSDDGRLQWWDATGGSMRGMPFRNHARGIRGIAASADGAELATYGPDGGVQRWDAATGTPIGGTGGVQGAPAARAVGTVSSAAHSADGRRLALVDAGGRIHLIDTGNGASADVPLEGAPDSVGIAFESSNHRLVTVDSDGMLRRWNEEAAATIGPRSSSQVIFFNASPLGTSAAPPAQHTIAKPLAASHGRSVDALAFSPDGARFMSGGGDGMLRVWDSATGQPIGGPWAEQGDAARSGHTAAVLALAFSPDGARVASSSADGKLRLWDANTGQPLGAAWAPQQGVIQALVFSPDGTRLVTGASSSSDDGTLQWWDATTGRPIGDAHVAHALGVQSLAFSADGTMLASGGLDGTIRRWDGHHGQALGEPVDGHDATVEGLAFSPDSQRLASVGGDGHLRLWDARSGQARSPPLRGHGGAVMAVAFSPDGRRIVTAGTEGWLRLWDAATGQVIDPPLQGHVGAALRVAINRDGSRIASGGADGRVLLWPGPAAWNALLCARLTRNPTADEWARWLSPSLPYQRPCTSLP